MRKLVDGIDGHGQQCNVVGPTSRSRLLLARFDQPLLDLPREERVRLLGGKGDGLMRMAGELALPVPPGFILTTRACALYLERGWSDELEARLREGMAWLEQATGRRFGARTGVSERAFEGTSTGAGAGPTPLLVSVRSGAPVSMPGMLDTLLNVGLDEQTTAAFARESPGLAQACRARLDASFRELVGSPPPAEVWGQLRSAVEAVFRSARSPRALAYRRREGLPGDALTAVNVQTMVFGNHDARSATGVFFTRDPSTGEARPFGDVLFEAQGEDVVSGRHATLPYDALASRLPEVARALDELGRRLERAYRDLCEIEFTIESGRLWLLQVRVGKRSPRAALRIASELALDPAFPLERAEAVARVAKLLAPPPVETRLRAPMGAASAPAPIARGLGASPGIASGEIATTVAGAVARAGEGHAVVLVRPETSPEDVEGMGVAAGLLTARGGLASHAAVVARGWGIPAVVGLEALAIDDEGITIAGHRLAVGSAVTIDGSAGAVFAGALEVERETVPEAARLLEWARELGIALGGDDDGARAGLGEREKAREDAAEAGPGSSAAPSQSADASPGSVAVTSADAIDEAILRVLAIKGSATRDALVAAVGLGVDPDQLAARIEQQLAAGDLVPAKPIGLRLGELARSRAQALLASDRERLGAAAAEAVLVSFQALDARMKEAVTDWQLRLDGAERVPNDHTDARWDASVLERLRELVADAERWLADPATRLPRLRCYAERLGRALAAALAGDARFIASPRVDSLHGVWFELHEDLIRLAGSDRAKELAAGRAG
ncbi:MAG: hypothetical protein IPK00_11495 [Deltaproteobacteria bacterium]|nr:hypothetical protein [Deltaproteobacteria bacterium]